MSKKTGLIFLFFSIVIFSITIYKVQTQDQKVEYTNFKVQKTDDLILNGVVNPEQKIKISEKIPTGTNFFYDTLSNGQFVRKGESIGTYTYNDVDTSTNLKIKQLVEQRNEASKDNSTDSKIQVNDINKDINNLTAKLYTHEYVAPFDGYVQFNLADKKNATFISASQLISTSISQYDLPTIDQSQNAKLLEEATGTKTRGKIDYISLLTEAANKNYALLVKPEKHLNYGNSIEIKIPVKQVLIPSSAVNQGSVYLKQGNGKYTKATNVVEKQNNDWVLKDQNQVKVGDQILLNYKELPKNER